MYNGERFLRQAIDSILNQTYRDFELIISDNASTDSTETICRSYEAKDSRVRYDRNSSNIGANPNFRRVFGRSRGEYYKWAAHDDFVAPAFLEKCVRVLDDDSSVALCYTREFIVDDLGKEVGRRSYGLTTSEPELYRREDVFRGVLGIALGSPALFGLMRRDILAATGLLGTTHAADQVLLAELALHGRFHEIPEYLLSHREHAQRSVYENPTRQALMAWVEPSNANKIIVPTARMIADYIKAILRAPVDWATRFRCGIHVARWTRYHWTDLWFDLGCARKQIAARFLARMPGNSKRAEVGRP